MSFLFSRVFSAQELSFPNEFWHWTDVAPAGFKARNWPWRCQGSLKWCMNHHHHHHHHHFHLVNSAFCFQSGFHGFSESYGVILLMFNDAENDTIVADSGVDPVVPTQGIQVTRRIDRSLQDRLRLLFDVCALVTCHFFAKNHPFFCPVGLIEMFKFSTNCQFETKQVDILFRA